MKIILYVWIYKLWSVPIKQAVGDPISKIFKCSPLVLIFTSETGRRKWDLFRALICNCQMKFWHFNYTLRLKLSLYRKRPSPETVIFGIYKAAHLIICLKTNKGDVFVSQNVPPYRFRAGWSDLPSPTLPHPSRGQVSLSCVQSHLVFCARARQLMMYSITEPLGHIHFEAQHFAGCHLSLDKDHGTMHDNFICVLLFIFVIWLSSVVLLDNSSRKTWKCTERPDLRITSYAPNR